MNVLTKPEQEALVVQSQGNNGTSLRDVLRRATTRDHHAIDHHPLLAPLLRRELSLEHYRRVLQSFLWIYTPLDEPLRLGLQRHGGDTRFRPSERLAWLSEDLASLASEADATINPLTGWCVPPIETPAALVGALYVVEGSTLGGQLIGRVVGDNLGINPSYGGRFFHGHGEQTRAHWEAFWELAHRIVPASQHDACAQAARKMFSALHEAFTLAHGHWRSQTPSAD